MLSARTILERDGLEIADVACRHGRGRGSAEEADRHSVGFVRRGCFARTGAGGEELLDPSSVFFVNLGEEQRYDHPYDGGDDCTAFLLDADLVASLWGGDPVLPSEPLHAPSALDLEHRLLLATAHRGGDADALAEQAILLLAGALELSDRPRAQSGRPARGAAQKVLVARAREALAADPGQSLPELSRSLAVSPHHLSRLFRSVTGHTISRHRMRLRARAALERLAGGEHNLARLAADLGFADQSHLCRVVRSETGSTPSALRGALRP
jgi:AraC-like DNA-binding protein